MNGISTVGVDFFRVFLESSGEVSTSSGVRIDLTGIIPILHKLGINKLMIDHVFNLTFLEFFVLEVHDSVSNE